MYLGFEKIKLAVQSCEEQAAWRTATETKPATGRIISCSFGRARDLERVAVEVFKTTSKSQDAVSTAESLEEDLS